MPRYSCPICGDQMAYPMWIDADPPEACPGDESWHDSGRISIKDVTQCKHQMARARTAAAMRRIAPDAFDENGVMKDGEAHHVFGAYIKGAAR